jgi:solute carrier family 39 (zinc transporter), member 7
MVAFAVGGLMGDTLFHLLPEIFLGEDDPEHARFVLVEPNRNLLLGVAILVGFMTFVAMDKGLRIATAGEGHDHGHGHLHEASQTGEKGSRAVSTSIDASESNVVSRKSNQAANGSATIAETTTTKPSDINPSVKLGGYLNLM